MLRFLTPHLRWSLILVVVSTAALGCDEEKPQIETPQGVTLARDHLYPYVFEERRTLDGTRILIEFLAEEPSDEDEVRMARWLLGRTWMDMLTTVVTKRAMGLTDEADALLELLATDTATKADQVAIAKAIRQYLVSVRDISSTDPIGLEADAGIAVLDAITSGEPTAANRLAEIGQKELGVSVNARLLMAASGLTTTQALKPTAGLAVAHDVANGYPFPCAKGFDAFASGDHSLEACEFRCAGSENIKPGPNYKKALIKRCGGTHYGFVDDEDGVYLTPTNYVLVQALNHMGALVEPLQRDVDATQLGMIHRDFVRQYHAALSALTIPLDVPIMDAEDTVRVPLMAVTHEPAYGVRQSVAITPKGIYVDLPSHARVKNGQVFMPEVILRYRFPGKLAEATTPSFSMAKMRIDDGELVNLETALEDLERDRPRLSKRVGDLVPGAVTLRRHITSDDDWRRTRLLVDPETPKALLSAVLYGLHDDGYHPFDLVVWNPETNAPGAVRFDTADGPPPRAGWRVRIYGRSWMVLYDGNVVGRANPSAGWPDGLVDLYTLLDPARKDDKPIYVTLDGDVGVTDLALVLEVLGLQGPGRESGGSQTVSELIAAHGPIDHAATSSARVLLIVEPPSDNAP